MAIVQASAVGRVVAYLRRLFGGRPHVAMLPAPRVSESTGAGFISPRETDATVDATAMRALVTANPWAMAGIREIAQEIAARPVQVCLTDDEGRPVPLGKNHPLAWFLRNQVRGYTLRQYVERQVVNLLITGELFAEVYGRPTATLPQVGTLIPHDPEDANARVSGDETELLDFRVSLPSRRYLVPRDRMVFCALSPALGGAERFRGISPLYPLIPELRSYAKDQGYQEARPRGSAGNLAIKFSSTDDVARAGRIASQMNTIRERTGYTLALKGVEVSGLPESKEPDQVKDRQREVKRAVMVALGIAPVTWDESVTNDSASEVQQRKERRMMRALSNLVWRQHEPLARLLARPGEMDAGLHIRTDWTGELEAEEQAAELARLGLEAKRAEVVKTYTDAGVPLAEAMRLAGVDTDTEAADADRDKEARGVRRRLRAV